MSKYCSVFVLVAGDTKGGRMMHYVELESSYTNPTSHSQYSTMQCVIGKHRSTFQIFLWVTFAIF